MKNVKEWSLTMASPIALLVAWSFIMNLSKVLFPPDPCTPVHCMGHAWGIASVAGSVAVTIVVAAYLIEMWEEANEKEKKS